MQLNVLLLASGYVNSAWRQAMAEQARSHALHNATLLDLRVFRDCRGVSEGVLRVQARLQSLRSADQLVDSSRRSQCAGVRTSPDVLNAEERKDLARSDPAQVRYEYQMERIQLQSRACGDRLATSIEVNAWQREAQ